MSAELEMVLELEDRTAADFANASENLNNIGRAADAVSFAVMVEGATRAKNALGGIASTMGGLTEAAAQDELATMKLIQAVENAGQAYGDYEEQINAVIAAGMKKGIDDTTSSHVLAELTAMTGSAEEATNRYGIALDLARGAGMDLTTAARLVGKVNEDNINVFKRYGITVKEGATEAEVLAEVQKRFAGQADAYAQSSKGQADAARVSYEELQEQLGYKLLPVQTSVINAFMTMPESVQIGAFAIQAFGGDVAEAVGGIGQMAMGLRGVGPLFAAIGPAAGIARTAFMSMGAALLTPPLGFVVALVAAGVAIYVFRDEIISGLGAAKDFIVGAVGEAKDFVVNSFNSILDFGRNNWPEIATLISGPFFPLVALATDAFGVRSALEGAFRGMINFISGLAGDALNAGLSIGKSVANGVIDGINYLIGHWNGLSFSMGGTDLGPLGSLPSINVSTPDLPLIPRLNTGMRFVPGVMPAILDPGEAVLTRSQADAWRSGQKEGNAVNVYVQTVNMHGSSDVRELDGIGYGIERALATRGVL